jgi:alpha-galactosidase
MRAKYSCLLLLIASLVSASANGQSVAGRWATTWNVLDNGEVNRGYLDLKQNGTQVTGTITTLGHIYKVTGSMIGNHLELTPGTYNSKPRLAGELVGSQLRLNRDGELLLAIPAGPEDFYPPRTYLAPPELHIVPSNGLALTPPMGWNSWNQFQDHADDQLIREIADALVSSGMRDAGYVYVNIDDAWEGVRDAQGNLGSNRKFADMGV